MFSILSLMEFAGCDGEIEALEEFYAATDVVCGLFVRGAALFGVEPFGEVAGG